MKKSVRDAIYETNSTATQVVKLENWITKSDFKRPQKVTDFIATQIRQKIINGELMKGDKLPPQNQLLEEFGVSRPTLREAFRILEAEKLITTIRGARGGAFINAPDPDLIRTYTILVWRSQKTTVGDIFAVRKLIEPIIARQLALNTSEKIVNALQLCLDEEKKYFSHDSKQFAKAVADFHRMLIKQFGNHPLSQLMDTVNDVLQSHIPLMMLKAEKNLSYAKGQSMVKRSFSLTQKLIDLIAKGDAEGAQKNWEIYMDTSYSNWMSIHGDLTIHSLLTG